MLNEWGQWRVQGCRGLGYPSCTPEARLTISPGRSTMIKPEPPEYRQSDVGRRVENSIHTIPAHDRNMLWLWYAQRATDKIIMAYEGCSSIWAARRRVEKSHKLIAEALNVPLF